MFSGQVAPLELIRNLLRYQNSWFLRSFCFPSQTASRHYFSTQKQPEWNHILVIGHFEENSHSYQLGLRLGWEFTDAWNQSPHNPATSGPERHPWNSPGLQQLCWISLRAQFLLELISSVIPRGPGLISPTPQGSTLHWEDTSRWVFCWTPGEFLTGLFLCSGSLCP